MAEHTRGKTNDGGGVRHPRRGRVARVWTLLAAFLSVVSGCYTYTETPPTAVPPGSDVRLRLDGRHDLRAGDLPLPGDGRLLRGRLLAATSPDTLLCSVALTAGEGGGASRGLRGTVPVPLASVERLETRTLDRVRTAVSVGAFALLGFVVLDQAFDIRNAREGTDDSGGVNNGVIARFRWRW